MIIKMTQTLQEKRAARRKITAEDFTPIPLVNQMLDKLPSEVWEDSTKTFCDPAAGNGNFIVEVLKRKLQRGHSPLDAINSIWSVELMEDNVQELHQRLLDVLIEYNVPQDEIQKLKEVIKKQNVCYNSLEWDFENWCPNIIKTKSLF